MTENRLKNIKTEKVKHPGLKPDQPFTIETEYRESPMEDFYGDMHYALQMGIVLQGSMEVMFQDYTGTYGPGEVSWTMLWEPHAFRFTGNRNLAIAVNIDFDYLGNLDPFDSCGWILPFTVKPSTRYRPYREEDKMFFLNSGRRLYKLWRERPSPSWKIKSWMIIHDLVAEAADSIALKGHGMGKSGFPEKFKRIKPAIEVVRGKTGRPPRLDEAAAMCGLSASRFSFLFKDVLGISFGKFSARARLAASAADLKKGEMSIKEIADKWGFVDHSHYLNSFKKLYGYTPSVYREK
jgi:AraC-like DNA-binding protein